MMKTKKAGRIYGLGLLAALTMLLSSTVFATHFELSRIASQVELISGQLAHDLRYTRYYGSVRQRAVNLEREAAQLVDSLRRNRSNSRIRSRFKDVRRGYERLESAFFAADRRDHDPRLYQEINLLSDLFASLSNEFYYAGFGTQNYDRGYYTPRGGSIIIGSRYQSPRYRGSRDYRPRGHERGRQGSRTNGRIVPSRESAIPPVFRGNNPRIEPNRQNGRGEGARGQRERAERGRDSQRNQSRGVQSPTFDHSSPVLDRQSRQNADRREAQNRTDRDRTATSRRESSNTDRGRRSRGSTAEGRRRNN